MTLARHGYRIFVARLASSPNPDSFDPWAPHAALPVPPPSHWPLADGFNRISQVCEMHIAGYAFRVLTGAFAVHDGIKEPTGFHAAKEAEQNANRLLFRKFKEELKRRYAPSLRRCHD